VIHHTGTKSTKSTKSTKKEVGMDRRSAEARARADELPNLVIGAAIEVQKQLGPGLLESAYEACQRRELTLRNIPFAAQVPLPVAYRGLEIECRYRIDLVVADLLILELKAVQKLGSIHEAQLLTYLRLTNTLLALLNNFNVIVLKNGIKRIVYG
jgi:GxxExxY protein